MTIRKKKSKDTSPDSNVDGKNWWKNPAIIVGILTLLGTIIATLPAMIREINGLKNPPLPEATSTPVFTPPDNSAFCAGYFSSNAVEVQSGIPKTVSSDGKSPIEIKLMDNLNLIGGIKFSPETGYMFVSDQSCSQIKPPFEVEAGRKNNIEFGELVVIIAYEEPTSSLTVEFGEP
jgi:hypothetical protein